MGATAQRRKASLVTPPDNITEATILSLLRTRYPLPSFAFIPAVPNGTSGNKTRTADAFAMGCWRSVGVELQGFEIKVSRSDWRREIQKPEKSAAFAPYVHRWWIAAPKGVVELTEMPAEWGLMTTTGSALTVQKAASRLAPLDLPHTLLASILRRWAETDEAAKEQQRRVREAYEQGVDDGKARNNHTSEHMQQCMDKLTASVSKFQVASGVSISGFDWENTAQKIRRLLAIEKADAAIEASRQRLLQAVAALEKVLPATEKVGP